MFDQKVGSRTVNAESITITIKPGMTDTISFLDVIGASFTVEGSDPLDVIVLVRERDLISTLGIIDGYAYCFNPIVADDTAIMFSIPPYSNISLDIIGVAHQYH